MIVLIGSINGLDPRKVNCKCFDIIIAYNEFVYNITAILEYADRENDFFSSTNGGNKIVVFGLMDQ